jgi:hypothetical protein
LRWRRPVNTAGGGRGTLDGCYGAAPRRLPQRRGKDRRPLGNTTGLTPLDGLRGCKLHPAHLNLCHGLSLLGASLAPGARTAQRSARRRPVQTVDGGDLFGVRIPRARTPGPSCDPAHRVLRLSGRALALLCGPSPGPLLRPAPGATRRGTRAFPPYLYASSPPTPSSRLVMALLNGTSVEAPARTRLAPVDRG